MSTNSVKDYTFSGSTKTLHELSLKAADEVREEAASEVREEAVAAKETPVSKLTYTPTCREITAEYFKAHHKISSIALVLDHQKIERHYKPEVFAHIDGPFWIRPFHTAVVIPILEIGASNITLKSRAGAKYDIVWQPGSIHYLGGDVSLHITGGGRPVFIFLLFKMKE